MSLLISGPKALGNDIDVYLQPLIDEVMELWNGVETYGALTNDTFKLHAALMWTINDFPAYGNLSGWKTKGYLACPYCNVDTCSFRSKKSKKLCFWGRRCLPDQDHPLRRYKVAFNGKVEERPPPKLRCGADLLYQMRKIKITFGKHNKKPICHKRKRKGREKKKSGSSSWKKVSIFFTLPYWKDRSFDKAQYMSCTRRKMCENLYLGRCWILRGNLKTL